MKNSLLGVFARHRVAANLLMVMMFLSGVIALQKLNVQFFPNLELDQISVSTVWSGASSEDIETGITIPLEQRLRSIDRLKEFTSTSATGVSGITLEFDENSNMTFALDEVKKNRLMISATCRTMRKSRKWRSRSATSRSPAC